MKQKAKKNGTSVPFLVIFTFGELYFSFAEVIFACGELYVCLTANVQKKNSEKIVKISVKIV